MGLAALAWAGSGSVALAAPVSFNVALTGAEEVPPVQTAGTGTAALTYDPANRHLTWSVTESGLSSDATMAHFHGPAAAGKNAAVVIWVSKKGTAPSGTMTGKATLTRAQAMQFMAGEWYVERPQQGSPGRRNPRPGGAAEGLGQSRPARPAACCTLPSVTMSCC